MAPAWKDGLTIVNQVGYRRLGNHRDAGHKYRHRNVVALSALDVHSILPLVS